MTGTGWQDDAITAAIARVRGIAREVTDFPHITEARRWVQTADGVWTGGFWAGLLWLAHAREGQTADRDAAIRYTERLLARAGDRHNHDLGFMFFPSAVTGWRMTGEPRYREAAIAAAVALAGQYNPRLGMIPGWGFFGAEDWAGRMLIDTLMNLPLLVWAVGEGADPKLMDAVHGHLATTLEHSFRADGSVYHVFRFDPVKGTPLGGDTYQGHGAETTWARGQAWAVTALAILAAMTGDAACLRASRRAAARFAARLPEDGVPPWDFDAPGPDQPKDASAGAIAAYGCLKLHDVTGEAPYLALATRLLRCLAATCGNRSDAGGLLLHATADLPHGHGIDESTMYGDYYYLKSLLALQRTASARRGSGFPARPARA